MHGTTRRPNRLREKVYAVIKLLPKDPSRFEATTAGLRNIVTIVAVVSAGAWTFFQWNRTIFPKESYERFLREAARRVDLSVKLDSISTLSGNLLMPAPDSAAADLVIFSGTGIFNNEKDFPISIQSTTISVRFGGVTRGEPYSVVEWRKPVVEIPTAQAVGLDGPFTIEPEGSLSLQMLFGMPVEWPDDSQHVCFYDLQLHLELVALDPQSGREIHNSTKSKTVGYRSALPRNFAARDFLYADSPFNMLGGLWGILRASSDRQE